MILFPLRIDLGRMIPARLLCKGTLFPYLRLDLFDMIEIIDERGVYLGERD